MLNETFLWFSNTVLQCKVILGISFQFQRKRMPDGHNKIYGAQVIYSNVTRKHSGTYVCEGSNGSGFIAKDTIKIDVIRKFFQFSLTFFDGSRKMQWNALVSPDYTLHTIPKVHILYKKSFLVQSGFLTPKSLIRLTYFLQIRVV